MNLTPEQKDDLIARLYAVAVTATSVYKAVERSEIAQHMPGLQNCKAELELVVADCKEAKVELIGRHRPSPSRLTSLQEEPQPQCIGPDQCRPSKFCLYGCNRPKPSTE